MLLCIGDSLTFGSVGYSYIKYLRSPLTALNKGLNGDTTLCAFKRLQGYLSNPKYAEIDAYVVAIGTNDLLLPYIAGVSPLKKIETGPRVALKKCLENEDAFIAAYEDYLKLLSLHGKRAILVGLPFLQLKNFPNHLSQRRNEAIKALAEKYKLPFIDIYALELEAVKKPRTDFSWYYPSLLRVVEDTIMAFLPFTKDWFSKARHLEFTVDGAHFNSKTAKLLAKELSDAAFDL
ncbi:MAG: SGNH/GDSL hydrolase family protein [Oscillospiraceae bacterium]